MSKTGARYLMDKKRYLLASNTDSIQQLIENQKNELTQILITQKAELDKITREAKIKVEQTAILEKKIKAIEGMDSKTKKKSKENKETIETQKDVLGLKNDRKEEEEYNQKTLQKQIEKLNQDLLLIQKEILKVDNEGKRIDKKLQRAKFNENQIRQKTNNVHSEIENIKTKNKYEKSDQDLQIQYYETIIKQKYMFIQSADERKERQKKIAQEAKNDSNDKEEVEKRNELHLLILYNQYLREKMNEQLKQNLQIEKTLNEIRDICGSEDLDLLVEIVLLRGKRYNYCVKKVAEIEKEKNKLENEVNVLNEKFNQMKTQVLIEEPYEKSKKINVIKSKYVDKSDKELIQIEKNLNKKLFNLGEKHNEVNLSYNKVIENINNLKEYYDEHPYNLNVTETTKLDLGNSNINETTNLTEIENKKDDDNNENKEENEKKEENDNNENKEIILTKEEEEILKDYKYFIRQSAKTFDELFLLHSKQEFLEIMKEKGKEKIKERTQMSKTAKPKVTVRKIKKESTQRTLLSALSRISRKKENYIKTTVKAEDTSKLIKRDDDENSKNDFDMDKDIIKKFLDEQKKERSEFLKNDKDKTKSKSKKTTKKKK
jgi:hypothetical protein